MLTPEMDCCDGEVSISVVMACYTAQRLPSIRSALMSLRDQSLQPREVVVAVDNNEPLVQILQGEFDWVSVVLNSSQRGASATRNAGADVVQTPYVAFLDDDETADPHWLAELTKPFRDPNVVGTGGKYEAAWTGTKPSWFPDEFAWAVGGSYLGMPQVTSPVRNVWSGNMAIRTAEFSDVAGFRTDFGKREKASQPEDTDLCIRVAAESGGQWMYVPSAVILHEVPETRASLRFFLARCYSEGAGKALMRANLGSNSAIAVENAYVRTVFMSALGRLTAFDRQEWARALVIFSGVACAGLGYATTQLASLMGSRRRVESCV